MGGVSFKYLGIPVGGNHRTEGIWKPIIDIVRRRLTSWNNKHLSIGGLIILVKSVLFTLSVYYLSFFKALTGIILKLESLFKNFLWYGGAERRKMNWVRKRKFCREKKVEGLGIQNLKFFNLALLGKWKWRLLIEKNRLWVEILCANKGGMGLKEVRSISSALCGEEIFNH